MTTFLHLPLGLPYFYQCVMCFTSQINRWTKRGLAVSPALYGSSLRTSSQYPAYVAIYSLDGTANVAHGGVEMGQGINTKVLVHLS